MAQVFTTPFQFRGATYTALVSLEGGSFSIRINEPALLHVLPDGQLHYNPEQGLELNPQDLTDTQDILAAIFTALQESGVLLSLKPSAKPSDNP